MATQVTDPTQIEKAVEELLVSRIDAIQASARQKDSRNIFSDIVLTVAILRGRDKPVGPYQFKTEVVINIMLSFSDASGEEARREGINPLVQGIRRKLARQRLNLDITDILPRGWEDVTTEELWEQNKIVYNVEFATSFTWSISEDGETPDLLGVGIEYFLQPGDDIADAEDDLNTV
ncbi:MAG: hypothetical protein HXX17_15685 [Geobacteraceae bacterium]|nr:hypothetical protein [Geobacteraceae bacterium]